jgi:membrane protease YdiL (CAAX protease family)
MQQQLRAAIVAIWVLGGIAAYFYSHQLNIPARVAIPVAAAFLVELSLYAGMQALPWTAPLLWASGSVSYLIYSVPTGVFGWQSLLLLAVITGIAVAWMRYSPPGLLSDAAFLAFFGAVYIGRVTHGIYAEPFPKLQTPALAQLMCFRLAITCLLRYRSHQDLGFGFFPTAADWRIGVRYFLYWAPVAAALIYALQFRPFRLAPDYWWRAPLTFISILWVVGLAEECLFRGMLLHHLRGLMRPLHALALSSLAFGLTHLWFSPFPNWKFAILASVAGLFYGQAYIEARAVRASMVAHALTVTAWRTFLA